MKKRSLLFTILAGIVTICAISLMILLIPSFRLKNRTITIEAGEKLNLKIEDLVNVKKNNISEYSLDISEVDTEKTGEYTAFLMHGKRKTKITVIVEDTLAPEIVSQDRHVFVNDMKKISSGEMFQDVIEYSDYEIAVMSCEKVSSITTIINEDIKILESTYLSSEGQEMSSQKEMKDLPTEEGVYLCVVKMEDTYGNATYGEILVVLDKTAPSIKGDPDMLIETSDVSKTPDVDNEDYLIVDLVDGVIPNSETSCKLELTDNSKHEYVNYVTIKDRAGNTCTESFKVTLVKEDSGSWGNIGYYNSSIVLTNEIGGFPLIYQMPELPTGCEITALTMALNYYGYPVSKITMARDYLPQVATDYVGKVDLDYFFCGNPFGAGTVCGAGALVTAADSYLEDAGSDLRAVNLTGASAEELYGYVEEGKPVVVIATIGLAKRRATQGWYTTEGKYVEWSTNDHGVVLIGCDSDSVKIACPLLGIRTYSRAQFESSYASRGYQAVILQ